MTLLEGFTHPPQNTQAEQALLGAILVNNAGFAMVDGIVEANDFYEPVHRRIYAAMASIIRGGGLADPITLAAAFERDEALRELDGSRYLAGLARAAETILNGPDYARVIADMRTRRDVIAVTQQASAAAHDTASVPKTGMQIAAELHERSARIIANSAVGDIVSGREVLRKVIDRIDRSVLPFATGIRCMDRSFGGGLRPGSLYAIEGKAKRFKAQPLTEPVLMADGTWKPMGDIKIGDMVASVDGAKSLVSGVYPRGKRLMYRVTASDGRSTLADAEHLWDCFIGSNPGSGEKTRTITTEDLKGLVERGNRVWLPRVSGHFGHSQDLPVAPYTLGVLLGDGGLSNGSVRFSNPDDEIANLIAAEIDDHLRIRNCAGCDRYIVRKSRRGGTNTVLEGLKSLGLMGKRSDQKFIPEIYLSANQQARLELLQGILDTDSQAIQGRASFTTTSERLMVGVRNLARSLGMVVATAKPTGSSYRKDGVTIECRTAYRLSIRADNPQDLYRCSRKKGAVLANRKKGILLRVISVEPEHEHECQCIQVTHPTHQYITRDYLVTHNTGILAGIHQGVWSSGVPSLFVTLELSPPDIVQRAAAGSIGIGFLQAEKPENKERFVRGAFEFERRHEATLDKALYSHAPGASFERVLALCSQAKVEHDAKVFVVDYWQRIPNNDAERNQSQHLEHVANALADFAARHDVAIVMASQLNRGGESLASSGLERACAWRGKIHIVEVQTECASLKETGIWIEVTENRYGSAHDVGSEEYPAMRIAEGPTLKEYA